MATVEAAPVAWAPTIQEVCTIPSEIIETPSPTGLVFNVNLEFGDGVEFLSAGPIAARLFSFPFVIEGWDTWSNTITTSSVSVKYTTFEAFSYTDISGAQPLVITNAFKGSFIDLSGWLATEFDTTTNKHLLQLELDSVTADTTRQIFCSLKCRRL